MNTELRLLTAAALLLGAHVPPAQPRLIDNVEELARGRFVALLFYGRPRGEGGGEPEAATTVATLVPTSIAPAADQGGESSSGTPPPARASAVRRKSRPVWRFAGDLADTPTEDNYTTETEKVSTGTDFSATQISDISMKVNVPLDNIESASAATGTEGTPIKDDTELTEIERALSVVDDATAEADTASNAAGGASGIGDLLSESEANATLPDADSPSVETDRIFTSPLYDSANIEPNNAPIDEESLPTAASTQSNAIDTPVSPVAKMAAEESTEGSVDVDDRIASDAGPIQPEQAAAGTPVNINNQPDTESTQPPPAAPPEPAASAEPSEAAAASWRCAPAAGGFRCTTGAKYAGMDKFCGGATDMIPRQWVCDLWPDCVGGEDEVGCEGATDD